MEVRYRDLLDAKVKDILIRAVTDAFGNIPYAVANDGGVSALAGATSPEKDNVLGIVPVDAAPDTRPCPPPPRPCRSVPPPGNRTIR